MTLFEHAVRKQVPVDVADTFHHSVTPVTVLTSHFMDLYHCTWYVISGGSTTGMPPYTKPLSTYSAVGPYADRAVE